MKIGTISQVDPTKKELFSFIFESLVFAVFEIHKKSSFQSL